MRNVFKQNKKKTIFVYRWTNAYITVEQVNIMINTKIALDVFIKKMWTR